MTPGVWRRSAAVLVVLATHELLGEAASGDQVDRHKIGPPDLRPPEYVTPDNPHPYPARLAAPPWRQGRRRR